MKSIKISDLSFAIDKKIILDRVQLDIQSGEFFLLLGPSGCGKTTLLRLIAGFYQPQSGDIYFDDRNINHLPPQQRNIGMVFQSYALFPHLTVAQNIEYGLKLRKLSGEKRNRRISRALETVRLLGYENRSPGSLSGGEQQRVALARALAVEPDILLLDEPLSNLDAKLRIQMRQELRDIHKTNPVTMVYVTHDREEALSMADRMAIMQQGKILQIGPPQEIYYQPVNSFVAGFIGETNLLEGKIIQSIGSSQFEVETNLGKLLIDNQGQSFTVGERIICCIRPESVHITDSESADLPNRFSSMISDFQFRGESMHLILTLNASAPFRAILPYPKDRKLKRNDPLPIHIPPVDILLLKD